MKSEKESPSDPVSAETEGSKENAKCNIPETETNSSPGTKDSSSASSREDTSSEFRFESAASRQDSSSGKGTESSPNNSFGQENFRSEGAGKSFVIFNRPGISDETLIRAGIKKVTAEEAFALCGLAAPGIWIPYTHIDGTPVIINGKFYGRLRLDKPRGKKKYHQELDSAYRAYLPFPFYIDFVKGKILLFNNKIFFTILTNFCFAFHMHYSKIFRKTSSGTSFTLF